MKKILLLSAIASFAIAANSVQDLQIDQINMTQTTTLANGVDVSQGHTEITNNATVKSVTITQKDGSAAGNKITNSEITGTDSELHQGLTQVDNAQLDHATLESKNSVNDIHVTGAKSIIRQGNLMVGSSAEVSGETISPLTGASTGENLEIIQDNQLNTMSSIIDSTIEQGVTRISNSADVTQTFKLKQLNVLSDSTSKDSQLAQGETTIIGGDTADIEQNIDNSIKNVRVDGVKIDQSKIRLEESCVTNINDKNDVLAVDDKNRIVGIKAQSSTIVQSAIDINASTVIGLYKNERGNVGKHLEYNNLISDVRKLETSIVTQSETKASSDSEISNVTYKNTHDIDSSAGVNANNHMQKLIWIENSKLSQEETTLKNAALEDTTIDRENIMWDLCAKNSILAQNELTVTDSTVTDSDIRENNLMWDIKSRDTVVTQGSTIVTN